MTSTKTGRSDASSDLELARALSRTLGGKPALAPLPPGPAYTRLPRAAGAPEPPSPRAAPPPVLIGAQAWNQVLAECLHLGGALGVFALDASGLVVGSVGEVGLDPEGAGSRLVIAFEHADRMADGRCRTITVDLGDRTLTGVRLEQQDGPPITMGLVSVGSPGREFIEAVASYLDGAR